MKVFIALAFIVNTLFTAPDTFPTTTGTSSLIIPAFSLVYFSSVCGPDIVIWSKPILVITHRSGVMILVQSRRPPMPTSITATSTFWSANSGMPLPCKFEERRVQRLRKRNGGLLQSWPHTLRESFHRWYGYARGNRSDAGKWITRLYSPRLVARQRSYANRNLFPFVPAICIVLNSWCGWPKCSSNLCVVSKPGLYALPPICWNIGALSYKYFKVFW